MIHQKDSLPVISVWVGVAADHGDVRGAPALLRKLSRSSAAALGTRTRLPPQDPRLAQTERQLAAPGR